MPSCTGRAATRSAMPCAPLRSAAARISPAAAGVTRKFMSILSMFALGAQQARQPVALFLRPADGKEVVQVMVAAAARIPGLGEVADHHAHLRLHAVLVV